MRTRTNQIAMLSLAMVATAAAQAWGFGEDITTDNHSTAHYDMTLAFARCAGFSAAESLKIAEADEVTDTLAYGSTAFEFTDREGPDKSYFHFPEDNGSVDINGDGPLHAWANGTGTLTDLTGATLGVCDAAGTCCDRANRCVTAGSLEAVGVWLHAVADFWSHHACIVSGGRDHGTYDASDPAQLATCPTTMHGHEWGARDSTEYIVTLQANAVMGLRATRDLVTTYAAEHGKTSCGTVSDDDLLAFASGMPPTDRETTSAALYAACDAAPACAEPPPAGPDADPGTPPPDGGGGGCDSAPGTGGLLGVLAVGLIGIRLRRRAARRAVP